MRLRVRPVAGRTLADQLFQAGVEFPCGGDGVCGRCRMHVLHGKVPVTAAMRGVLSAAELRAGWRLACCAFASAPIVVQIDQWSGHALGDAAHLPVEPCAGLGAVVDLGTTTLVAQIVDLASGEILRVEAALNPQARYGADVMSRLSYEWRNPGTLGPLVRGALRPMLGDEPLCEILVAGNTAMHHLFCGIDPQPLMHAPFVTPHLEERYFEPAELGWPGPAEFLPCLGGFVGSDVLCGIVATDLDRALKLCALCDIGTNGEVVAGSAAGLVCASTAAGPAFEGGRIASGMRAGTGAIDHVRAEHDRLRCHVIGGGPARGLCGSGLLDAVACGVQMGLIQPNGRLLTPDSRLALADAVVLTQGDVRELQLAKGAIAAGLRTVVRTGLDKIFLAGAFGNYLHRESAHALGLLPEDAVVVHAGNAALRGARTLLLAPSTREARVRAIARMTRHVELATNAAFLDMYPDMMALAPFRLT